MTINFRPSSNDVHILEVLGSTGNYRKRNDIFRQAIEDYSQNIGVVQDQPGHSPAEIQAEVSKSGKGSQPNITFTIEESIYLSYSQAVKQELALERPHTAFLVKFALRVAYHKYLFDQQAQVKQIESNSTLLLKASIEKVCAMITTDTGIEALKKFVGEPY